MIHAELGKYGDRRSEFSELKYVEAENKEPGLTIYWKWHMHRKLLHHIQRDELCPFL